MKRESKYLLKKAVDSLVLSVEHYNRPSDRGRVHAVLILIDHAFEMLLKAGIIHRGGKIWKPKENQTIGFNECLGKASSEKGIQFLTGEQVLQLQVLNGLRDAAQHHLLDLSEQHFYMHVQGWVYGVPRYLHCGIWYRTKRPSTRSGSACVNHTANGHFHGL